MRRSRHWLWLLLLLPVALGLARLRLDVEVLNLLPADLPVVRGLKLYQTRFDNGRELVITVRAGDATSAETAARALAQALRAETNLTRNVAWQPFWLEQPAQAAELAAFLWFNQPSDRFAVLTNRLSTGLIAATLTEAREQLATSLSPMDIARRGYDPFNLMSLPDFATGSTSAFEESADVFAAVDGTFRLLYVEARSPLATYRDCAAWLKQIRAVEQRARAGGDWPADAQIRYTARPAFVAEVGTGMESDMISSVAGTMGIIVILFGFAHRRWAPLLWMVTLLLLILVCTVALGGLIFGTLNVVSVGFAAILLGLAVDYGLVLYQEAQADPHVTAASLRRQMWPSIVWSAVTTAGAFLMLNLSELPGLGQLGSLVAIGIFLAAAVMLFLYLPPLLRRQKAEDSSLQPEHRRLTPHVPPRWDVPPSAAWAVTALVPVLAAILLSRHFPGFDHSSGALRPRGSPAFTALEEIKERMQRNREPVWVLVQGENETEVARRLEKVEFTLRAAVSNQLVSSFTLPTALWPRPEFQDANRPALAHLIEQRDTLRHATLAQGFTTNAFVLADSMFNTWQQAVAQTNVFWPTNDASRWVLGKLVARSPDQFLVLGLIQTATNPHSAETLLADWPLEAKRDGVLLSGWELLGAALFQGVRADLRRVLVPMVVLLLVSLGLAFRRTSEVCLSLAALAFSAGCLWTLMSLAGWSWNLLNMMALPLLLGAGVDYSIHMQLALRRHGGDTRVVRRTIGRALLLCAATTVAGFGSLSWSKNTGMASLGQVCAVGVACCYLTAVFLLPAWWKAFHHQRNSPSAPSRAVDETLETQNSKPETPSSFYRAGVWRIGLLAARWLPASSATALAKLILSAYACLAPHRRLVVAQNLGPIVGCDPAVARQMSWNLFRQFAVKLTDLLRYEAGRPLDNLFAELTGWEHFVAAQDQRRGVLLVTPHLGNWEFGGPLLTQRGYPLQVITLAEPGRGLTEMRQASRARWGIETLVLGEDPFAFVEVIRRLEAGATVALLIDRPLAASAVTVELFGQPFHASIAAAELARASGCVLLPVCLPRTARGYAAHVLPEIAYERATLRSRAARVQLTQQIMRAFEPAIRQHPDQWYHFVPIWPKA